MALSTHPIHDETALVLKLKLLEALHLVNAQGAEFFSPSIKCCLCNADFFNRIRQ
jgi:hypothetical protein